MDRMCNECGEVFDDVEQVRRHLRKHSMTTQEYSLKWDHGNIIPKCACGCGQGTSWNVASKDYTRYVQGHHAWGRKKSEDEKRRIGEKNQLSMRQFMIEHPELGKLRNQQMRAAHTPETEAQRLEATRQAYSSMSDVEKQPFRDRTKLRWQSGELATARAKGVATFRERSINGEYDFTERNAKLSEAISQKYVDGTWQFSKGTYVSTKTGKTCYYRSSWELLLMQELDADDDVVDWEYEFTSITYQFEGTTRRYVPDFHVTRRSGHQLIEVKPISLRFLPKNEAKRTAAQAYCAERGWCYVEWEPSKAVTVDQVC